VAYTYSHSIGNVDLDNSSGSVNQEAWLNNADPALNKGNTDINRPHIFVANEVLFLPKLGDKATAVRETVGGWEFNSIVTAESRQFAYDLYLGSCGRECHTWNRAKPNGSDQQP
jgi:hypothetical protein